MKKHISYWTSALLYGFIAILAASWLWSCTKDEGMVANRYAVSVEVCSNVLAASKTSVEQDNSIIWSADDKLGIFAVSASGYSASSVLAIETASSGKATGKFIGELTISEAPQKCWFAYPSGVNFNYSASSGSGSSGTSAGVVTASFSYDAQSGLHNPYLYGSANYSQTGISAALHHVGGMLKVLLPQESPIKVITVAGNNGEKLSPYIFTFPSDGSVAESGSGEAAADALVAFSVNISENLAVTESGMVECYIAMPPVVFAKGFRLVFTDADGNTMYKSFNYTDGCDFSKDVSAGGLRGGIVEITVSEFEKYAVNALSATVTAEHVFEGGKLTGTKMELAGVSADLSGSPMVLFEWGVEVYNGNGELVRSISSCGNPSSVTSSNTLAFDVANDWPYLPAGTYTIKPFAVNLNSGAKQYGTQSSVAVPVLDASLLKATVDAKTSYSYYLANDLTNANKEGSGSSIYNITAGVNISDEILKNSKYTVTATVVDKTTSGNLSVPGELDAASQILVEKYDVTDWKAYTIASYIEFDGVKTAETTMTVHVTGLPYKAAPPTNTGSHPWRILTEGSVSYISFESSYVLLKTDGKAPSIGSSPFHIPDDINISLYSKYEKNNNSLLASYTYSVQLLSGNTAGNTILSHKSSKKGMYDDLEPGNSTLTSTYNAVLCKYDYSALGNTVNVYTVEISYR